MGHEGYRERTWYFNSLPLPDREGLSPSAVTLGLGSYDGPVRRRCEWRHTDRNGHSYDARKKNQYNFKKSIRNIYTNLFRKSSRWTPNMTEGSKRQSGRWSKEKSRRP